MSDGTPWTTRFDELSEEIERVERQVSADDIEVKTYPEMTKIHLTYDHGEGDSA